ncbi:MAG: zeta toxin family protein, partial [Firmicutes bacterium]|nr:zeta toxin family protein [Bacillota bacterium]
MKDNVILIGVAGGSGSGKSTLIERIKQEFKDQITVICHDSYYKRQVGRTYDERAKVNYDHPDAFETELMIEHLKLLKEGYEIEQPVYDYTIHNRSDET